jgi:hypothetical protein
MCMENLYIYSSARRKANAFRFAIVVHESARSENFREKMRE